MINLGAKEKPFKGQDLKADRLKFCRIGRITRVDYERGVVDLSWIDNFGEHPSVDLPSSFSSSRGSIRGMPEIGSQVVCGWTRQSQTLEKPVILGFLDINYQNAIEYRLSRNNTSEDLKESSESRSEILEDGTQVVYKESSIRKKIGYGFERSKRRKIYPGEIQAESTQGAELYLHDDVYLSDKSLNEIEIVSADKSIRLSSRQQYSQSSAARISNGLVTREPIENTELFQPTVLPNGQRVQIVTRTNNPFHLGGKAFTEYRIETYETSSGQLNISEVNSGYDVTALKPYATFLLGTTVGNDKSDVQRYSKVFRPQLFSTPTDIQGKYDELECLPEEYNTLAGAFQLKLHKSNSSINIDKQGHLFTNFASSTSQHPLGAGRSWEGNFEGSVKLVIGANALKGQSLIIDTKGSIREQLGSDILNLRSKETIAKKAIYTEVLSPDKDGNALIFKTVGHVQYNVQGSYYVSVTGDYVVTVNGKIQENIMGTKQENYINDKNNVYGANYKELIIKHKDSTIGAKNSVTISGVETEFGQPPIIPTTDVDTLKILIGSRSETYLAGDLKRKLFAGDMTATIVVGNLKETIGIGTRETDITTGDNKETIFAGSHTEDITTGNYEQTIVTGNHEEKITTGNNTLEITTGDRKETITTGSHKEKMTTGGHKEVITTGDHAETITTGSHKETITTGSHVETIKTGSHKETITAGDHAEVIKTGSHSEKITTGDHKETIKDGSHNETITSGNHQVTVKTGNFNVSVTAGNIAVTTKTGSINIKTSSGKVDVSGKLQVTVKSGVKLVLSGPLVSIGSMPTKGGIVTGLPGVPSTLCFVTGLPLIGSKTVSASI